MFNKVRAKTNSEVSFAVFMGFAVLGTLIMVLNPASQIALMVGAAIASLGMGNCFTLFYTYITGQYNKEKELTISSLGSISVVLGAVLTMLSPALIERGHFQASLLYGLSLISVVALLGLPIMKNVPIIRDIIEFFKNNFKANKTNNNEKQSAKPPHRQNPFEDLGKWWHYPKDGPNMKNPTPQN